MSYNKAIIGTLFTPRRFGVAAPLYTKAPLHKQCPIWRRYVFLDVIARKVAL